MTHCDTAIAWWPGWTGITLRAWWFRRRLHWLGARPSLGMGLHVAGWKRIEIEDDFACGRFCALDAGGGGALSIGPRVALNTNVALNASVGGRHLSRRRHDHRPQRRRPHQRPRHHGPDHLDPRSGPPQPLNLDRRRRLDRRQRGDHRRRDDRARRRHRGRGCGHRRCPPVHDRGRGAGAGDSGAMSGLVLSLFPGIGLLDMAFEEEGFCVVRGPDLLWGGDVRRFHPPAGKFDGVIGGPPCQAFSRLRYLVEWNGHTVAPNMIPEYERVVSEAAPQWFLMENVPQAPAPVVDGYVVKERMLKNRAVGGEQERTRRFCFGTVDGRELHPEFAALDAPEWFPAVLAHGGQRLVPVAIGGSGKIKATGAAAIGYQSKEYFDLAKRLQGLPADFDLPGFTVSGKIRALGNGVPLPMGRAIAKAVKRALQEPR